ncbi:ankyrin repeat-containing domain protein [Lasiosphaeris hirsuta]|uniref:Ankyrin repeat-containing domain protein n=1 Tax=Lasiosphaeris hirsuta TaxID=260670 RepID=A0AA40B953_9PEZI|nr:ankyrin repeat-containing domain protein [Lasiosphaeris hirsuta]
MSCLEMRIKRKTSELQEGCREGGSSAGTFEHIEHIEPDDENPSWIYSVQPVAPADQPLHHAPFEGGSFATSGLDLTPFATTAPFATFGSNTDSPGVSSPYAVYQQVRNFSPSTATAALRPVEVNIRGHSSASRRNGSSLLGLLHLAVRNGSKAIAQALLTAGASANARDDSGALPLHLAVQYRRRSMADLLLTYGADPDAENAEGITPLELAVRCRDEDIVNLLISRGARIT